MFHFIYHKIRSAIITFKSIIYVFLYSLFSNIKIGKQVKIFRKALIYVSKGAQLDIGDGVILNSDNYNYHLNMHSSCKILIDRAGGKIVIGSNTRIHGSCLHAYNSITIGKNCLIAANCQIIDGNGHDLSFPNVSERINTHGSAKPIIIEDNVWLGTNVVVLPGVTIGEGSIITANSVVHKSVPPMVVAGGNPLQIFKNYE